MLARRFGGLGGRGGEEVYDTNLPIDQADSAQVQTHYKNLLEVEEAFCELKSYLQVRPVFPCASS